MKIDLRATLLFTVILFCSCKQRQSPLSHNKRLLSFKSEFKYSADEIEKLDTNILRGITADNFNTKTDTIEYLKGEIYISCLRSTAGCSEYAGDVQFDKDTITLLANSISGISCTEMEVRRMIYTIENKDNRNYFIKKR
jgi:hypothetical protein